MHENDAVTAADALTNAARILRMAETETNLALMERLEGLADSWMTMAALMAEREKM